MNISIQNMVPSFGHFNSLSGNGMASGTPTTITLQALTASLNLTRSSNDIVGIPGAYYSFSCSWGTGSATWSANDTILVDICDSSNATIVAGSGGYLINHKVWVAGTFQVFGGGSSATVKCPADGIMRLRGTLSRGVSITLTPLSIVRVA